MISKDSNYLNAKLKELKQSVLSKQNNFDNTPQINNYKANTERSPINYRPPSSNQYVPFSTSPLLQNNYLKKERTPEIRKTYHNSQNNILQLGTNDTPNFNRNFTKFGRDDFDYVKEQPRILIPEDQKSPYKNDFMNQTKYEMGRKSPFSNKYETPNYFDKSNVRVNSSGDYLKSNRLPDQEILRNVMEKSFQEGKHEKNLIQDLNEKHDEENRMNQRLSSDLDQLNRKLDTERKNLAYLDDMFKEELKITKEKESEVLGVLEKLEMENQKLDEDIQRENNRAFEQKTDFDKIERENAMLKNELKKIMELTGEKILEIENNINSLGRMKEFEKDNYEMEKEKFTGSSEFVIEQMRTQFLERNHQIDDNIQRTKSERDKLASQIKVISEELRAFNSNADHKIKNIMSTIINEEENKQKSEIREIEDKIRIEEDQIKQLMKENQDKMQFIQSTEREVKTKIISRKNENVRLKEEINVLEQQYNKLLLQFNNTEKDNEKKHFMVNRLEEEKENIDQKSLALKDNYQKELELLEDQHQEEVKEIEDIFNNLLIKEKDLINEIKNKNNDIIELQKRQTDIIEQYQNKLNQTLTKFDNNVKKDKLLYY
jgi:hypothetical protein